MTTLAIIEDDETFRAHLADILQLEGFTTHEATNGLEGLALIQDVQPDMVICDIAMPVLDGFGMVDTIRKNYEISKTPVIFMTARKNAYFPDRAAQLGAAPVLYKPFTVDRLLQAIHRRLTHQAP